MIPTNSASSVLRLGLCTAFGLRMIFFSNLPIVSHHMRHCSSRYFSLRGIPPYFLITAARPILLALAICEYASCMRILFGTGTHACAERAFTTASGIENFSPRHSRTVLSEQLEILAISAVVSFSPTCSKNTRCFQEGNITLLFLIAFATLPF